jgi:hypothetical protein
MATETQIAVGDCPTHGVVEGARELPRVTFPPLITAFQRAVAKRRRPYRCPTCGAPVQID